MQASGDKRLVTSYTRMVIVCLQIHMGTKQYPFMLYAINYTVQSNVCLKDAVKTGVFHSSELASEQFVPC